MITTPKLAKPLCATLLLLCAGLAQATPKLLDSVAAVVEDDIIMNSELDQQVALVKKQNPSAKDLDAQALRSQVLDKLILDSIQLQMADRGNIRISDEQLNDALQRIAAQNNLTLSQFRQTMEKEGVPFATARQQIMDEMRISRVQRFQVGERIQITDQDIDYFLASDLGKMASSAEYRLGHILIATPAEAKPADIKAAEAKALDIANRLRQGADFKKTAMTESNSRTALEGGDLGWRKEAQLPALFAALVAKMSQGAIEGPIPSASGFHIIKLLEKRGGNTQLVTQYQTRHILIAPNELRDDKASKQLADDLAGRLKQGDNFATLAREYSNDPGSSTQGGSLGWVNAGDMVPEFNQVMLDSPVGKVSAPFHTQFGWHILEVQAKRETDVGVENQRNQVRNMLYQRRFEEELPIWLRKIRSEAYVEIKS